MSGQPPQQKAMNTHDPETEILSKTERAENSSATETIDLVPQILHLERILVPIDFSETSLKALQYAIAFARQFDANIILLNVVQPTVPLPDVVLPDTLEQDALKVSKEELSALASRVVPASVNWRAFAREGLPFDSIVELARETKADMIILSTHGRTGLKHVLLGSTAEKVVRHAPCPVLVVREREQEFL